MTEQLTCFLCEYSLTPVFKVVWDGYHRSTTKNRKGSKPIVSWRIAYCFSHPVVLYDIVKRMLGAVTQEADKGALTAMQTGNEYKAISGIHWYILILVITAIQYRVEVDLNRLLSSWIIFYFTLLFISRRIVICVSNFDFEGIYDEPGFFLNSQVNIRFCSD